MTTAAQTHTRRPRMSPGMLRLLTVALGAAIAAASVSVAAATPASTPRTVDVAHTPVTRLVQSTGNLYWTTNVYNAFGQTSSAVYRTSKSGTPGAERALYTETGSQYFGALTYALVNGAYYGYFADQSGGVARIKRIPLAGGTAVTLATRSTVVGTHDLVTDGTTLFWSETSGVSSMPINGGAVTQLVNGSLINSLTLDATHVYFATGSTTTRIMGVLKSTGQVTTYIVTDTTVTSLFVRANNPWVFWGETDGSVRAHSLTSAATATFQAPLTGRHVTSTTADATRVRWSDCTTDGYSCTVRVCTAGHVQAIGSGSNAHDVWGDGLSTYWGGSTGVHRYSA